MPVNSLIRYSKKWHFINALTVAVPVLVSSDRLTWQCFSIFSLALYGPLQIAVPNSTFRLSTVGCRFLLLMLKGTTCMVLLPVMQCCNLAAQLGGLYIYFLVSIHILFNVLVFSLGVYRQCGRLGGR